MRLKSADAVRYPFFWLKMSILSPFGAGSNGFKNILIILVMSNLQDVIIHRLKGAHEKSQPIAPT
jgi:hypothetical protein